MLMMADMCLCYRFFTSDVGNGGVLLIPRGQKGLLYSIPAAEEKKRRTKTKMKEKDGEEEEEEEGGDGQEEQMQVHEEIVQQTEREM